MNVCPPKFDSLFNNIIRKDGYYDLTIETDQVDLVLDLLRLDKDHQEYIFDYLYKDYRNEHRDYLGLGLSFVQFKNFIYRGQKDCNWELVPGSLRDYTKHNKSYTEFELENILNFMKCTDELNIQIPKDSIEIRNKIKCLLSNNDYMACNNWMTEEFQEMLGYAQHYGAVTRLLDWSYHPLVGLYFASVGSLTTEQRSEFFSLYIFNTDYLNVKNPEINLVDVINIPKGLNKHISYQKGCFTLTNQASYRNTPKAIQVRKYLGIEFETKPTLIPDILQEHERDYCLLKINFPAITANQVFRYCNSMGFNASSIYQSGEALKNRIKEMEFL